MEDWPLRRLRASGLEKDDLKTVSKEENFALFTLFVVGVDVGGNIKRYDYMIFWTVKYTNTKTQIHKYTVIRCRKYPTCAIFSKNQGSKDIKNDILNCQKYKYTGDAITMYLQI